MMQRMVLLGTFLHSFIHSLSMNVLGTHYLQMLLQETQ